MVVFGLADFLLFLANAKFELGVFALDLLHLIGFHLQLLPLFLDEQILLIDFFLFLLEVLDLLFVFLLLANEIVHQELVFLGLWLVLVFGWSWGCFSDNRLLFGDFRCTNCLL